MECFTEKILDQMKPGAHSGESAAGFFRQPDVVSYSIWGECADHLVYAWRTSGIHVEEALCLLISSVGFFFSCVTPSATGGQPMQIYFMKKEKIPIPVSTVILMIVTITYKLVLVVIGLGILLFGRGFQEQYLTGILPVFYLWYCAECILRNFYDDPCISSVTRKEDHGQRTEAAGALSPHEKEGVQAGKAGSIHGYVQ